MKLTRIFVPVVCQNGHKTVASFRWDPARLEFIFETPMLQCFCPKGELGQGYRAAGDPYIKRKP